MKIVNIKSVGVKPVHDISVEDAEHYVLENGVISHNTAMTYTANTIFIITKSQEKATDGELEGWKFTINIHKSRYVKEKEKLAFKVLYDGGIQKYSGMLEIALDGNFVQKPKVGWYSLVDQETGELGVKNFRAKDFETDELAGELIKTQKFKDYVKTKFKLSTMSLDGGDNLVSISDSEDDDFDIPEEKPDFAKKLRKISS